LQEDPDHDPTEDDGDEMIQLGHLGCYNEHWKVALIIQARFAAGGEFVLILVRPCIFHS
jgi:hypothetical protein